MDWSLADQAEFIADMAEKREFAIGQCTIERFVLGIGRIEVLSVGQDFHQDGSGIGTAMDFLYRVLSLRVDRGAGKKSVRIGLGGLQHIIVADEKLRVLSVE